jgi:hypothetical protein
MRAVADAAIRAQREISRRLAEGALHDCTRGWGGRPHPYLATRAQASWMACYAPKKGQGCYMQRVAPLAPVLRLTSLPYEFLLHWHSQSASREKLWKRLSNQSRRG